MYNFHQYYPIMQKFRVVIPTILVTVSLFTFFSCKSNRNNVSEKTGVKYNDPYNGGLQINRKVKESPGPGLIAIEGGTFVMGGSLNEDIAYAHDNLKRRVTVASFLY